MQTMLIVQQHKTVERHGSACCQKMYESSGLVSTHVVTDSDGKAVDGFVEANEEIKKRIEKKNTGKGGSNG